MLVSTAGKRLWAICANPNNVRFDDLIACAKHFNWVGGQDGSSHHVYRHPGPPVRMVTLQRQSDGKAKPYQVKQFIEAMEILFPELMP